ncbi:MAG: hypothetical protein GY906_37980 [bacterium]|nr:hypothetical protein [bacterium]
MASASPLAAGEFSGFLAAEGSYFLFEPLFPEQEKHSASLVVEPEYYHEWESGSSFTFVPFARIDSADKRRSHFDIREFNFLWFGDRWELLAGVGKVFWGTTEFVHLVDIINQTDAIESLDGEAKLGQPMARFSFLNDWGVVDFFVLPYFRERTFAGDTGRLRLAPPVDTEKPGYESDDRARHIDFAVRYSRTLGTWDLGCYYFTGTGREPTLLTDFDNSGTPVLIPYYEQIDQIGLDLQGVVGEWLLKLEALRRTGQGNDFLAAVGGLEYTFVGLAGSGLDLGILGEFAWDERGDEATTPYQNDLMAGLRLGFNDAAGSQLLGGVIYDLETSASIVRVEGSRRLGSSWRMSLEAWAFVDFRASDRFSSFRDDDFVRLEATYHF